MTCRDFIDFLWRYLQEDLPGDERAEFDAHLSVCPQCRAYLAEYKSSIELGRRALALKPGDPVPEDAPEELITAILAARRKARG